MFFPPRHKDSLLGERERRRGRKKGGRQAFFLRAEEGRSYGEEKSVKERKKEKIGVPFSTSLAGRLLSFMT